MSRMRCAAFARVLGPLLLTLELSPRVALACSYALPPPLEPAPDLLNLGGEPPELYGVSVAGLERGVDDGCLVHSSFTLVPDVWDDRTPLDELGYRVERVRGDGPYLYDYPVRYMHFLWADDGSQPLDVELRVWAIDAVGNQSNPVDIRITDGEDGSAEHSPAEEAAAEGGCGLGSANGGGMAAWLSLAGVACALRRRRD